MVMQQNSTMSPEHILQAAELLFIARRQHTKILLPDVCRPQNQEEAYAIQHAVTERLHFPLVGWKIGAAARDVAEAEGAVQAVSGRLFAPHVHHSPVIMGSDLFTNFRNCELEFVYRLGYDLPVRAEAYTKAQLADAVDAIFPAIEIGDSRLADRSSAGMLAICADNAGGTELVLGDEITAWRNLDLAGHKAVLRINNVDVASGFGRDVMDDPLNSMIWLIVQQMMWGNPVPAGSLIATGSCTGINIAQAGDEVLADFGTLGEVWIKF